MCHCSVLYFPSLLFSCFAVLCRSKENAKEIMWKRSVWGGRMTVLHVVSNTEKKPIHMTVLVTTALRNAKSLFSHKHFLKKRRIQGSRLIFCKILDLQSCSGNIPVPSPHLVEAFLVASWKSAEVNEQSSTQDEHVCKRHFHNVDLPVWFLYYHCQVSEIQTSESLMQQGDLQGMQVTFSEPERFFELERLKPVTARLKLQWKTAFIFLNKYRCQQYLICLYCSHFLPHRRKNSSWGFIFICMFCLHNQHVLSTTTDAN